MLALLAVGAVAPATASAGLTLGAGVGLGKPGGSIEQSTSMNDVASWMIPIHLEAGWKFADQLTVVGFFDLVNGIVGGDFKTYCDASGDDCLVNQARFGAQARWNFMPGRQLDPFVGVGIASETLGVEYTSLMSGHTTNFKGLGYDLMGGVDYWFTDRFSVSPWLGLSFGTYEDQKDVSNFGDWEPIAGTKTHTLVTAGVRIGWDFGGGPRAAGAAATAP
jgi:hypothetical protein